jgi:hypothetical protein
MTADCLRFAQADCLKPSANQSERPLRNKSQQRVSTDVLFKPPKTKKRKRIEESSEKQTTRRIESLEV